MLSKPIDLREQELHDIAQFNVRDVYREHLAGIMISKGMILDRIAVLSKEISNAYKGKEPIALCMLDGAMDFYHHLTDTDIPFYVETLNASSYVGTESKGTVNFNGFKFKKVEGRDVLVVEDIIDTGNTLDTTVKKLYEAGASSVEVACLLSKPSRRKSGNKIEPDYLGFVIPDQFVVGFGLDYNRRFRKLKHIGVLTATAIKKFKEQ